MILLFHNELHPHNKSRTWEMLIEMLCVQRYAFQLLCYQGVRAVNWREFSMSQESEQTVEGNSTHRVLRMPRLSNSQQDDISAGTKKKHIYSSRDEECSFKICRLKISRVSYLFNMIKSLQGTCFSSGRDLNFSTTNCNIVVVDFEFSGAADRVSIKCAQPGERNKEIPQAAADLLWQLEQSTPVSGLNKQPLKRQSADVSNAAWLNNPEFGVCTGTGGTKISLLVKTLLNK